jgi:hypothetical protein
MGSQYQPLDVTLPTTLNTDVSPSELKGDESPDLRNVITSEPGHVRMRRGFKRKLPLVSQFPGVDDYTLVATGVMGDKAMLSYGKTTTPPTSWIPAYYGAIYSGTTLSYTGNAVIVSRDSTTNAFTATTTGSVGFYGKTVNYESANYGIVVSTSSYRHRLFTGANELPALSALYRWSGTLNDFTGPTATPRVNIANGATSGTFTAATTPTSSVAGKLLVITGTATNKPLAGYWYTYRITAHTAGASAFTIDRPYGLGEVIGNVPTMNGTANAADTGTLSVFAQVANAPLSCVAVNLFKERIFTASGHILSAVGNFVGYYGNLLQWSDPGQPERWTAQNFVIVDDESNNLITGMGTVADLQMIFKRNKTLVMSGSDESSFVVDDFSTRIGCVHSGSITNFEDKLLWAGEDGYYSFDGETLDEITQPEPGRGIKKKYRSRMSKDDFKKTQFYRRYPRIHAVRDNLVMSLGNENHADRGESYVYNARDKSWVEFGHRPTDPDPDVELTGDQMTVQGCFRMNEVSYAVLGHQIVDIDQCWDFEQEEGTTTTFDFADQYYDIGNDLINVVPNAVVQTPDLRLGEGDSVRIKEIALEHNCHFISDQAAADKTAWTAHVSVDPDLDTVDESYDVLAHNVADTDHPTLLPRFTRFYMDRFPDSWSLEGGMFRLRLTSHPTNDDIVSHKLYRVRLLLEPSKTRLNRNQ